MAEVSRLGVDDAGEILTLQRAAYVTEAQLHDDLTLPALTQSIDDLVAELELPHVTALGIRLGARLVAALRLSVHGEVAEVGRLTVVPDLQGRRLGSTLLAAVDTWVPPSVTRVELFTGERSVANIRLYERKGFVEFKRETVESYDLVFLARTIAHQ